ncbi:hypothetical protein M4951_03420 [Blastopirellula sp. J2-11]|uniref:hypothetical protein n=1 Tax=Blastopirellula sp. J2-11 TaxID=2943192 RepID=UPI0021CA3CA5|nr:hypothetical protein [Blastopirellula sp. J2-11]UUO07365.1 hypothetical protein M4951_03420 [Blastopirellula sp. J2-11]
MIEKTIFTRCLRGILVTLTASTLGCFAGGTGEVSGVVTVNGESVAGLEVMFSSEDGTLGTAVGYTQADGSYVLRQGRSQQGVRIGAYKVTIRPGEDTEAATRKNLRLPAEVSSDEKTNLLEKVTSGSNQIDFDLTSP